MPADSTAIGEPGGIRWVGDADNETIFGTDWLDILNGVAGDDRVYGFEGDDTITGGNGRDRLFGGPGDDFIMTAVFPGVFLSPTNNEGDFASGGSGNDVI